MSDHGPDGRFVAGNYPERLNRRKLTKESHERIVELVGQGNYLATAARATGANGRTLKRWLQRGEADHEAGRRTAFAALFRDVREAAAKSEAEVVQVVKLAAVEGFKTRRVHVTTKTDRAGNTIEVHQHEELTEIPPDWRAGIRLLESRALSRFGIRQRIEGRHAHLHAEVPEMSEEDERIAARVLQNHIGRIARKLDAPVELVSECFSLIGGGAHTAGPRRQLRGPRESGDQE